MQLEESAIAKADILKFLLGSGEYRQRHVPTFRASVDTLACGDVLDLAERTHLCGLLFHYLQRFHPSHVLVDRLRPAVFYYGTFANVLMAELQALSLAFSDRQAKPILLKGPAYWGVLYKLRSDRLAQDLDLTATTLTELMLAAGALHDCGYAPDTDDLDAAEARCHYELATFRKQVTFFVDKRGRQLLDEHRRASTYDFKITHAEQDRSMLDIDLELHKGIFMFTNGGVPRIEDGLLEAYAPMPAYSTMRRGALLPYTASKFIMDADQLLAGTPRLGKAAKLLGDFVRILEKSTPQDIALSLELASEWSASELYRRALGCAEELMPEAEFSNFARPKEGFAWHAFISAL
jgi:hypothetical protein